LKEKLPRMINSKERTNRMKEKNQSSMRIKKYSNKGDTRIFMGLMKRTHYDDT
jgi:hypothetical protein